MRTTLWRTLWWAGLYAIAVVAGRATALPETGLALFWPAAGVAALWLQCSSVRRLAADVTVLFTTTAVVNVGLGVPWTSAVLFGCANVAGALAVRQVLGRALDPVRGTLRGTLGNAAMGSIHGVTGVIALAGASLAAGVASAPAGVWAGYLVTHNASVIGACAWVVRNTTGVFVVAGVVLAIVAAREPPQTTVTRSSWVTNDGRRSGLGELTSTVAVTVAALHLIFDASHGLPLAFVLVALAAYVGFRFAPVVAAVFTTVAGLFAVVASWAGTGPFGTIDDPVVRSLVVQAFVLVQAAISLMLSWAMRERHDILVELTEERRHADRRAKLLDAVTDHLEHGVAVIDTAGRIVVQNPVAARLVPGPREWITEDDQPADYGVHRADGEPMDLASMPHTLALATGESISAELVVRRPEAEDTYVNVHVDPLDLDGDPDHRLAVVSMRDDTEHRRHVDDLETFAGAVAHDLRNPLAAMSMWVEVLTDHLTDEGTHDDDARDALQRMTAAADRMSVLIEDLLGYARANSAPIDLREIDLDACVREVADEAIAASGRGAVDVAASLGTLAGDPSLVRQVLANVIGNAIKYTADDVEPLVSLRAEHSRDGVVLRVTDNGVGVPEPMQATIFGRFTRVSSTSDSRPGSGLGLALCARAMQRHGGTITLTTGLNGVGSTVVLTFPDEPTRVNGGQRN